MLLLMTSTGLSSGEVVGLVLSVLGLAISTVLSIVLFILSTQKGMAYDIVSENITRNGAQVECRMRVELWNSGRSAIKPDHYGEPITFDFGSNAIVEEARVVDTKPDIIKSSARITKNAGEAIIGQKVTRNNREVVIGIPMLNEKDVIIFDLKIIGYSNLKSVKYHIADIKKIIETPHDLSRNIRIAVVLTVGICICFLLGTVLWALAGHGVENQSYDFLALLVMWVALLSYSFKFKRKHLYSLVRTFPWIAFVLLSYLIIHFSTIAYLPSFLSLGNVP